MNNTTLFKNKYRIESTRLKNWNYADDGHYFVTICTKNRECWFGEIIDHEMNLNDFGAIVRNQWLWLENQYPYINLDEYIILPDHTHAIIYIENPVLTVATGRVGNMETGCMGNVETGRMGDVETGRDLSLQNSSRTKIKSLPELVGAFKTTTSKQIRMAGLSEFIWQPRYYDRIIRTEQELNNVKEYIKNNAKKHIYP
ncbi:MAG: transposase [Candidatus Margulisiibacteriota bacterium]|jgi:REP element-mobilizing transposase RayT